MSGIEINVDESTECLVERKTGIKAETEVYEVILKRKDIKGWKFDWIKEQAENPQVFALKIKGGEEIEGLISTKFDKTSKAVYIQLVETAPQNYGNNGKHEGVGQHLFAEAVRQSYDAGYDGFVYFDAKTSLLKYYSEKLGAQILKGNRMFIDVIEARILYDKYYGGK